MDENPYKAPNVGSGKASRPLLRWPTVIEWVVILLVAIACAALFLPNLDEGSEAARKRQSQNRSP
jgi:hypothetical protein